MLLGREPAVGRQGRRGRRPSFFLFGAFLLCAGMAAGQGPHPLARGVRVIAPVAEAPEADALAFAPAENALPGRVSGPAGRGLLRFFGCATCHGLAEGDAFDRWGPDLDYIGQKAPAGWLRRWLEDPAAALPGARMPRVPVTEREREALVTFLTAQRGGTRLKAPSGGDAGRGRALFEAAQCRACHILDGSGGGSGPPLDRLGERARGGWVAAYLMQPLSVVPNARMPDYGFSRAQAEDLTAFLLATSKALLKHTEPPGRDASAPPPQRREDENIPGDLSPSPARRERGLGGEGLSLFAQKGCAGCHRVGRYVVPLARPDEARAVDFVRYHGAAGGEGLRVELSEAQARAMAGGLVEGQDGERVDAAAFLRAFWETPVRLQGSAPAAYDSLARDLSPEACGACHTEQFVDWRSTAHSRSMGAGVLGQVLDGLWSSPGFAAGCQSCHAPLAEQHAALPGAGEGYDANYRYDPGMQRAGLTCAGCHVRAHVRFGPPAGGRPPAQVWRGPGHGGAATAPAFQDAAFCRGCHQFGPESRRVNGKLLQDTHAQWERSPQAAAGMTCQACHMPGRRHLWRGIHDPEAVGEALELSVVPLAVRADSITVEVRLANAGAGHHVPTYVTPKIFVRAQLVDSASGPVGGVEERAVGWEVVLGGPDGDREVYDTRIPAGGVWTWRYAASRHPGAEALAVSVDVHPDHFYLGFFEAFSRQGLSPEAGAMIDSAEANARRTPYPLFERQWPLEGLTSAEPSR